MGENTNQIEREIAMERAELGRNLEDLEQKAKALTDWTVHYRNRPGLFLGAAVGTGMLLGALTAGEESVRTVRGSQVLARPVRERSAKADHVIDTWTHISDAFVGLATAKVIDVISEFIPGFRDQYERHVGPSPQRDPRPLGA